MDSVGRVDRPSFSLLETMRLEQGQIARLERHIARMAAAAHYFEYEWAEPVAREALTSVAREHPGGCWRVRLLLSRDGRPTIECTPHTQEARPWRLDFAREPVDATDPFVRYKTTHRVVYDSARRSRTDVDDVLLWNTHGEVTESTIANVVAQIDGMRYTPPVHCGLLGGTFRAEQLEAGTIRERVLTRSDVESATRLWLINSVRGWVEAGLISSSQ
jgi:para-aminobenzoate synthetase/4-amino-4-deoxychorismate lyase